MEVLMPDQEETAVEVEAAEITCAGGLTLPPLAGGVTDE